MPPSLAALRLTALGIAQPSASSPVAAVRHLLALQGQDYAGALWSIGLRTPGATAADVEAAQAAGDLVRSWPFRSTLHMVEPTAQLNGHPLSDVVPGMNGMFLSTIVVNGRIVGTWRRTVKAKGAELTAEPWGPLSATAQRGFAKAARAYADYLGIPLVS